MRLKKQAACFCTHSDIDSNAVALLLLTVLPLVVLALLSVVA